MAALAIYVWLIVCVVSYGITQSTSVNAYGIQPGTPAPIAAAITPAASIWYLAQYLTYGSVHVCGTFTHPCAWPKTWPGPDYLQNVNAFDDIWFAFFGLAFATFLAASRSVVRSVRALSVPPILLGVVLFFDDNYWFYQGFSDELNRRGVSWLTNENIMLLGVGCFTVSTIFLWWRGGSRSGAHRAVQRDRAGPDQPSVPE